MPVVRLEVDKLAWPEAFRLTLPRVFVPFLKVTVPVGTAVPGALVTTVAVKVTDWLWFEGLREEVTDVLVASLFTVWVKAEDVLVLKLALPP